LYPQADGGRRNLQNDISDVGTVSGDEGHPVTMATTAADLSRDSLVDGPEVYVVIQPAAVLQSDWPRFVPNTSVIVNARGSLGISRKVIGIWYPPTKCSWYLPEFTLKFHGVWQNTKN
jgi:hypothetical protein